MSEEAKLKYKISVARESMELAANALEEAQQWLTAAKISHQGEVTDEIQLLQHAINTVAVCDTQLARVI